MRVVDAVVGWGRRWPTTIVDAALAALVGLVTIVAVLVEVGVEDQPLTAVGALLLVAQAVALVWRRRAPVVVATVVAAAAAVYGVLELPDPPVLFSPLLAFYTVAAHRPRSVTVPVAVTLGVVGAASIVVSGDSDPADVAVSYFGAITAFVVGDTTRGQRERAEWLEQRRRDAAHQAARDERLRIARDLHDVVAHHVSVMAVQAEAAQEVLAARPDQAAGAMASVADTARSALAELRRLLGVLRAEADLAPQPDLDALDELVASVRRAGVPVVVTTTGEPRPVGPVVGLTAYRVVQEALTNVLKHAGATHTAEVGLAFEADALVVTVVDGAGDRSAGPATGPGRGAGATVAKGKVAATGTANRTAQRTGDQGHGLVGMRERVAVLGGQLDAGPCAGGGFAVTARLPLDAPEQP